MKLTLHIAKSAVSIILHKILPIYSIEALIGNEDFIS